MINMVSNIVSFIISMSISFLLTPYIVNTVGKEAYRFVGFANNSVISKVIDKYPLSLRIRIKSYNKNYNY